MDIISASVPDPHDEAIAALNDEFRRSLAGGRTVITGGVAALGKEHVAAVLEAVRAFDAFSPENDPYGEHDFGAFEFDGKTIIWKIDHYDPALEFGSEDPSDPDQTVRLLTVMLAEEY